MSWHIVATTAPSLLCSDIGANLNFCITDLSLQRAAGVSSEALDVHEFGHPIVFKDRLARVLMTRSPDPRQRVRGI